MLTTNKPIKDWRNSFFTALSTCKIGHHPLGSYQKKACPKCVSIPTKETSELALLCPVTVFSSSFSFEDVSVFEAIAQFALSFDIGSVDNAARSLCLSVG